MPSPVLLLHELSPTAHSHLSHTQQRLHPRHRRRSVSGLSLSSFNISPANRFSTLCSLGKSHPSRFLELPENLRHHYSNGRSIKVQATPHSSSIQVFTIQDGPVGSSHYVLITKSKRRGVHAIALDLPGSGFSDKSETVTEEKVAGGGFGRLQEKGLFWGFVQLVKQG